MRAKTVRLWASVAVIAFASAAIGSVASAQTFGDTKWVTAFRLDKTASWDGFPECRPNHESSNKTWTPSPGWIIVDKRIAKPDFNNADRTIETREGGLNIVSRQALNQTFELLIKVARADQNETAVRLLKEERDKRIEAVVQASDNKNRLYGSVRAKAHGSCTDKKRGWGKGNWQAQIRYIGDPESLGEMIESMTEKYL